MKETRCPLYRRLGGPRGWYIIYQYIYTVSRDSVVEIETGHWLDSPRFESRQTQEVFLFFKNAHTGSGATQLPIITVPGFIPEEKVVEA